MFHSVNCQHYDTSCVSCKDSHCIFLKQLLDISGDPVWMPSGHMWGCDPIFEKRCIKCWEMDVWRFDESVGNQHAGPGYKSRPEVNLLVVLTSSDRSADQVFFLALHLASSVSVSTISSQGNIILNFYQSYFRAFKRNVEANPTPDTPADTLELLNAPGVRYCRHTSVCPVYKSTQ